MLNGVYSSASAMDVASKQHEVIANNLANANVPGFRKTMLAVQTRGQNQVGENGGVVSDLVGNTAAKTVVDFSMGPLKQTNRSLDFAINGDGFFKVETAEGPRYTRNGSFHLDTDGNLVTAGGNLVSGGGGPIQVPQDVALSDLNVTTDGAIWANGVEIGNFGIVDFENKDALVQTSSSLFEAPDDLPETPSESVILQGTVEQSNVSIVHEMVEMIIGMRQFEAAQQSLKSISDVIQQYTTYDG